MEKSNLKWSANVMMGRDWSQANTSTKKILSVYLHGNHIATVWGACHGRDQWTVEVNSTLGDIQPHNDVGSAPWVSMSAPARVHARRCRI